MIISSCRMNIQPNDLNINNQPNNLNGDNQPDGGGSSAAFVIMFVPIALFVVSGAGRSSKLFNKITENL